MNDKTMPSDTCHFCNPIDPTTITRTGGEVDPDTGNAFFYKTKEELKTIHTPLMARRADGRESQIGFTSTTTKVITDEKHWLIKPEPDVMEQKVLSPSYGGNSAWPKEWSGDVQDPLADPQEFLFNFPTLAEHTLSPIQQQPVETDPFEMARKTSTSSFGNARPSMAFTAPSKTSISASALEDDGAANTFYQDFKGYLDVRI
jgi:hypothetical protein